MRDPEATTTAHPDETRASDSVFWTLRVKRALGLPRGAIAGGCAAAVLAGFAFTGHLPVDGGPASAEQLRLLGAALFFAFSIAFLLEAGTIILPAAQRDLDALRPMIRLDETHAFRIREALTRYPRRDLAIGSLVGSLIGLAHAHLAGHGPVRFLAAPDAPTLALTLATATLWVLMVQIALPLVSNARLFSFLGARHVMVDLYNPHALRPFGQAALRPTLLLIGLQAAYPLLLLGQAELTVGTLIGLFASLALVVALFFLPLRGIRRQILDERNRLLSDLDTRLAAQWRQDAERRTHATGNDMATTARLLVVRDRVRDVSSWPLGVDVLGRGIVYIAIPPLTWSVKILGQLGLATVMS